MIRKLLAAILSILFSTGLICQTLNDSVATKKSAFMSAGEINDKIFEKVESEAAFPGGIKAWIEYLQGNLNADVPVKKKAPVGTYQLIVKFIVAKDGKIRGIVAETNHGYGMEKEVIRIIKKGPNWLPAMQDGHAVNAYRRQPVTFMVSEE